MSGRSRWPGRSAAAALHACRYPVTSHVAVTAGANHIVTSPRSTSARSYAGQFPTRYVVLSCRCILDFLSRSCPLGVTMARASTVLAGSAGTSSSPGGLLPRGPHQNRTRRFPPSDSSADVAHGDAPQIRTRNLARTVVDSSSVRAPRGGKKLDRTQPIAARRAANTTSSRKRKGSRSSRA